MPCKCQDHPASAMLLPEGLERIGKDPPGYASPGGLFYTDYSFWQCPVCCSIWLREKDSGSGGHSQSVRRLWPDGR